MNSVVVFLLAISLAFAATDSSKTTKSTTATKSSTSSKQAVSPTPTAKSSAKATTEKSSVKATTEKSSSKATTEKTSAKATTEKTTSEKTPTKAAAEKTSEKTTVEKRVSEADSSKSKTSRKADTTENEITVSKNDHDSAASSTASAADDTLMLVDSASFEDSSNGVSSTKNDSTEPIGSSANESDTLSNVKDETSLLRSILLSILGITFGIALLLFMIFLLLKKKLQETFGKRSPYGHKNFLTRTRISIMDSEVQLVCKYIETHYTNTALSPESICQALTTGVSFVETVFKRELDLSLTEFIIHVRIHHALAHLNDGYTGSIEKLAILCGYNDISRFTIDFKTITSNDLSKVMNR